MIHYHTITDAMRSIAKIIFDSLGSEYYLAGGTALALQIGHRLSVDLDYFSSQSIDTKRLKEQLTSLFPSHMVHVTYEDTETLWCEIDGVQVSFITRRDTLYKPTHTEDMFRLVSREDITVMKLSALCGREEYKDYFDLACISTCTDIRSWVSWWETVYPTNDMTSWLIALGSFKLVTEVPLIIQEPFKTLNVHRQLQSVTSEITKFTR